MSAEPNLTLHLRTRNLRRDATGHNVWDTATSAETLPASQVALLLCDVWDHHWSRGAEERLEVMIPRMNAVVGAMRQTGALIIHAPSDTLDFYADHPARRRAQSATLIEPPDVPHDDPPLPIDASDHGSDTGETETYHAWTRQHPGITIDETRDAISADGREVYALLRERDIRRLLIMGVHTNMCVLHRSFAIKQMVRWGVPMALVRDLTDTMYNPAMPPYVSHDEGTRLVVEFIESFWCPSLVSDDLLRGTS